MERHTEIHHTQLTRTQLTHTTQKCTDDRETPTTRVPHTHTHTHTHGRRTHSGVLRNAHSVAGRSEPHTPLRTAQPPKMCKHSQLCLRVTGGFS